MSERFKFEENKIKKDKEDLMKLKSELNNMKNSSITITENI